MAEASREVPEEGCEEGGQKELRQGEESPHRARVGRSILYRQEGKNAHTCIPLSLADRDGVSTESCHVLRQARRQGWLPGAWHGRERWDGPEWLRDSDREVTALAAASGQDKRILVQLNMWPEP